VPSRLLDALSFAPPGVAAFEFTDWTAQKALHGGAEITSASPLAERQRLALDMVHSEATTIPFGLDRLATWPGLWGWDDTDLAWEATWVSLSDPFARVLRFEEGWDPGLFIDRLEASGYSRSEQSHGIVFVPGPDTEAILASDQRLFTSQPVSVAISPDGRTVAIGWRERANEMLRAATQADPAGLAASPFGRAAAALGRPLSAAIVDGRDLCTQAGQVGLDRLSDETTALARSIGPLHEYQALGIGYERAGPGEPAVGRYVFAYEQSQQAMSDLPGRRTLIDEGYSARDRLRYRDVAFTLVDALVDGRALVLDVAPLHDAPQVLFDLLVGRSLSFAACG
jgi:hypothetical protein